MRVLAIAIAIGVAGVATAAPNKPKPAPKPEPPPSPEKIRADKLFEDGRKYLAAKEYALACTAFEQSHEADPAIGTQLNIALCYEEWGKVTAAYRAYVEAERLASEKKDNRAVGAKKKVDELAPKVPRLTVEVPEDADVSTVFLLDGKEIEKAKLTEEQILELGKHTITARVPGKPAKETSVDLKEGDRKKLTIDVPRPDKEVKTVVTGGKRKAGKLYGGVALMVGGTAAIGIAGYVSLVARQDYADALKECNGRVCEQAAFDITQDARKKANLMTFVGAGGVVVAGLGLYLVLTSKTPRKTETVTVAPVFTPSSIGVSIGGSL